MYKISQNIEWEGVGAGVSRVGEGRDAGEGGCTSNSSYVSISRGGGGIPFERGRGCSPENLNLSPKGPIWTCLTLFL